MSRGQTLNLNEIFSCVTSLVLGPMKSFLVKFLFPGDPFMDAPSLASRCFVEIFVALCDKIGKVINHEMKLNMQCHGDDMLTSYFMCFVAE